MVASLFVNTFSSEVVGPRCLRVIMKHSTEAKAAATCRAVAGEQGSVSSANILSALPLVSVGGQFLCSFTLSCVKRGNSQSTRPRAGDEIRMGIWLPNQRQAGKQAGKQSGRQAEEQRGNRSSGKRLTFAPYFQQSEDGPATAFYR